MASKGFLESNKKGKIVEDMQGMNLHLNVS